MESSRLERFRRAREALEWTDIVVRHDWRLQERPGDGHCRIVGPQERIVREGSGVDCRAAFAALEQDGTVAHVTGPTVLVLHGLGEGRDSMRPLADHLHATLDASVLLFGYASTSADIDAHGRALAAVVAALPDAARISFVGHSLGNLVVRRWMALAPPADLARVHRMVMLGPPNRGSELARGVGGIGILAGLALRDPFEPLLRIHPCPRRGLDGGSLLPVLGNVGTQRVRTFGRCGSGESTV
jgi:pimeloyl-ACP methyl ester carboxylesterase